MTADDAARASTAASPGQGSVGEDARAQSRRYAVVGGGISGLAAAHRLRELDPTADVQLLEASSRLGGVIRTDHHAGLLLERGADSFITTETWATDLARRVGLADELIPTSPQRQAFVLRHGRPLPVPAGLTLLTPTRLWPLLTTPLLSWRGKLRMLAERFIRPSPPQADETLASFVRRRFGREAFERLMQPLIGGIYTADPERLSVAATMPRFLEMEQQHGSLIRATMRQMKLAKKRGDATRNDSNTAASGARYNLFQTPRDGLSSLIDAIAARLPAGGIRLQTPVAGLARLPDGRWRVEIAGAASLEFFDGIIVATPAGAAARLLQSVDARLSGLLAGIPYASVAIATLVYEQQQVSRPLEGFGLVVPAIEQKPILAVSFSSQKFPGRALAGQLLARVFLGGACGAEILEQSDDALRQIAADELAKILGINGQPIRSELTRWPQSMPQYHVGHLDIVAQIEVITGALPGLELAGNAYRGVGIPHCIRSGEQAAQRLIETERAGG